jgi:hypothetical protein
MSTNSSPLIELRAGSENSTSNLLFVSMYTQSYAMLAERLAISLEKHGLPYAVYEVPTVHNSISEKGSEDSKYTKSSFIREIINRTKKNIVYIDCDCEIKKFPSLLFEISHKNDFAIFNWLSTQENHVYLPSQQDGGSGPIYQYSHSIHASCSHQLICSGAVQFWANSESSIKLLNYWQQTIENNSGSADDYCLDFAFNNFKKNLNNEINYYWIPKAYSRYAWWIFDEPIIDHPQIPNTSTKWADINDPKNRKRFYSEEFDAATENEIHIRNNGLIIPKSKTHIIFNTEGKIEVNLINEEIWISGAAS